MKLNLAISYDAAEITRELQRSGYEAYIVGGAIRDLLLNRTPKDFDIATSATPEQVRAVFGRAHCQLIGKRFRLALLRRKQELYEISSFRQTPVNGNKGGNDWSKNLIVSDNEYGTARDDAFRRDFTVNSLFYDPQTSEVLDFTGMGLADVKKKVVRAIGDSNLRFEEDPVRMLRALKLVAQFDFSLDNATEKALFLNLERTRLASTSRLSLELEKILESAYAHRHLEVFHEYGLLDYFLPVVSEQWDTDAMKYAIELLTERDRRVASGAYRNSLSVSLATLALPFAERDLNLPCKRFGFENIRTSDGFFMRVAAELVAPETLINNVLISVERMSRMQRPIERHDDNHLPARRGYAHARELFFIRHAVIGDLTPQLEASVPPEYPSPSHRRHRNKKKENNA